MDFNTQQLEGLIPLFTTWGVNIVTAILVLIIGSYVARYSSRGVLAIMRKAQMDETLARFLSNMARYAVYAFTFIAVLSKFGIQTASLIAVLGAAGLAIGLAMQGTLSHIAAGVMLLLFRPFKVGDYVETGVASGTVDEIGLFFTNLNSVDNVHMIVPNNQLWDSAIKNYSINKTRRLDFTVGIAYDDNMDTALKALHQLVTKDPRTLDKPAPAQVMISNLGESSVDVIVRVWVKASDYWDYKWDITKAIKETLDQAGITIPFPQRELRIVSSDSAIDKISKGKKAAA